jgi:hypothetical protein
MTTNIGSKTADTKKDDGCPILARTLRKGGIPRTRPATAGVLSVLCTHFSANSAFKVLTFGPLCVLREISSLRPLRLRF